MTRYLAKQPGKDINCGETKMKLSKYDDMTIYLFIYLK